MRHGLGGQNPVLQFPRSLQLVQVLGPEVVEVLLEHVQQLQPAREQRLVGHVVRADATNVLVHDLLETLQTMKWQEVARGNGAGHDLVATHFVVFHWLEDFLFQILVLGFANLRPFLTQVLHVLDRRLRGDAAFGKRA